MDKGKLVKIGRILLSILFLFSAVSKIVSLGFFDTMVAEMFLGKEYFNEPGKFWWIQFLTRFLISAEFLLGVALLQNKWFKKVTIPATILVLGAFTLHLIYEGSVNSDGFWEGNCGCFGDVLPMTIMESIIKNVVGIAIAMFAWKYFDNRDKVDSLWVPFLTGGITFLTLFMGIPKVENDPVEFITIPEIIDTVTENTIDTLSKIDSVTTSESETTISTSDNVQTNISNTNKNADNTGSSESEPPLPNTKIKSDPIEKPVTTANPTTKVLTKEERTLQLLTKYGKFSDGSKLNAQSGEKLVALFSLTCGHCQDTYKDMCEMKEYEGSMPNVFLYNYGNSVDENFFYSNAGCKDSNTRIENKVEFDRLLQGKGFPLLIAIKDGKITQTWDGDSYSKESMAKHFNLTKPAPKPTNEIKLAPEPDNPFGF